MRNSTDNQPAEGNALQDSIQAIVAIACNQANIEEEFRKEFGPLLATEALFKLAIRTDQDYDCLQHAGVQTQLLRKLADRSNLDFGKEPMDFESEAHCWIDETAKKIADEMEKQLEVIDLAFVVLWPSETEKVRLVMAPDGSVAEVLYYPNGKPGTDEESTEETPIHPELSLA